jgi:hypothetical protein
MTQHISTATVRMFFDVFEPGAFASIWIFCQEVKQWQASHLSIHTVDAAVLSYVSESKKAAEQRTAALASSPRVLRRTVGGGFGAVSGEHSFR